MKKEQEILKNNFKSLRVRVGLSQEDVSKKLKISRTKFLNYENNPISIKIELLLELSYLYNCELKDFFIGIRWDYLSHL